MKMKEVVARTGLSEKTIRFYEERGLVKPETEWRNGRTYHEFSDQNVDTLNAVVKLREARFAIGEILSIQNDPRTLPDILDVYRKRIKQEHAAMTQLQDFATSLNAAKINNFQELYQELCNQPVKTEAYIPELHFGKFDSETDEEKRVAVIKQSAKKELHYGRWFVVILCLVCAVSLVANMVLLHYKTELIPAATESTTGWVYYLMDNSLMRCLPDGSSSELIYQKSNPHNEFDFVVGDERIYFIDGTELYSVNADGTGKHQYDGTYEPSDSSHYSSSWPALALNNGMLYACYSESGKLGAGTKVIEQISTKTGARKTIRQVYAEPYFAVSDDRLYLYDIDDSEINMQIIELETGNKVSSFEIEFVAEPVWFSEGTAYFSVPSAGGSSLLRITESDPNGTVVDKCNGWYWGGYQNHYVYSDSVAFVTSLGVNEKKRLVRRDHVRLTEYGVVTSDANKVEITAYP